jgi:hypothetical protein
MGTDTAERIKLIEFWRRFVQKDGCPQIHDEDDKKWILGPQEPNSATDEASSISNSPDVSEPTHDGFHLSLSPVPYAVVRFFSVHFVSNWRMGSTSARAFDWRKRATVCFDVFRCMVMQRLRSASVSGNPPMAANILGP